jgi:nicotinamide riboside transporter PnuC
MTAVWFAVVAVAIIGSALLVRSLRDVRDEVTRTVDSFTEFQAALAPILVVLRDETREVALRVDLGRPGSAPTRG